MAANLPGKFAVEAPYHHDRKKESEAGARSVSRPDRARTQGQVPSALSLCLSNALSWSNVLRLNSRLVLSTEQKDYTGEIEMALAQEV